MKNKQLALIIISTITLTFLLLMIGSNYYSLNNTKDRCIKEGQLANVQQSFLSLNWSVSCEKKEAR
jgi:hypothetical protein